MESGGQSGIKKYIKEQLYKSDFTYNHLEDIIIAYAKKDGYNQNIYKSLDSYVIGMRNDYMAFVRNERQILFYYGFFHSKSSGSNDREFSSLTPIGELALNSNFYELLAIWEHQKLKMVSQPVNIEINGLRRSKISNIDNFSINLNPYITILKSLKNTLGFSKEAYQYIISRLSVYPTDGICIDNSFIEKIKTKVISFKRNADNATEDFNKELLKYILGIRSDLYKDHNTNPLGLCKWDKNGVSITNSNKLDRLIQIYSILCDYKLEKNKELFMNCTKEIKTQYSMNAQNNNYKLDPKIKIEWDMYNIHPDLLILLSIIILITEILNSTKLTKNNLNKYLVDLKDLFPNILKILDLYNNTALNKELKKIITVFEEKTYDVYLKTNAENDITSINAYFNSSLTDLKEKIEEISLKRSKYVNGTRMRNMTLISLIKSYNLQIFHSNGNSLRCECCGKPTFITYKNEPYFEYHHMIPFGEYDGPDHKLNILALCPMCHRKLHFLKQEDKKNLYNAISINSYNHLSVENRLIELYKENNLKSYQLEFLLADNAIDEDAYNRILNIA